MAAGLAGAVVPGLTWDRWPNPATVLQELQRFRIRSETTQGGFVPLSPDPAQR